MWSIKANVIIIIIIDDNIFKLCAVRNTSNVSYIWDENNMELRLAAIKYLKLNFFITNSS